MILEDYLVSARANEEIFRQVLSDLKENQRPKSSLFPKDLDLSASLEEIYGMYSTNSIDLGHRILYFKVEGDKTIIAFDKNEEKKKFGVELRYIIESGKVKFDTDLMDWELNK